MPDPCRGFYEWTKNPGDGGKDPWHIFLPAPTAFSFAGIWAHNKKLGITSCSIITAPAVNPVAQIHDRMPVILDPAAYDNWLDPSTPPGEAKNLLSRNLNGHLRFHRVDRRVNTTKGGPWGRECIEPVNPL